MKKIIFLFGMLLFVLTSCTFISADNIPGKRESKFPKYMQGEFKLLYPGDYQEIMGNDPSAAMEIKIEGDKISFVSAESTNSMQLNQDSVALVKVGKTCYFCLGKEPSVSIFKVVKNKKDIELYPMYAEIGTTGEQLTPYFSNIREEKSTDEEGLETITYKVHVEDDKLADYFKSEIPLKDPFVLKRIEK